MSEWKVIENFLNQGDREKNSFLIQHQISSFNFFIEEDIPDIINHYNPFTIRKDNNEYQFTFSNPRLSRPFFKNKDGKSSVLFPFEAQERGISYTAPLMVDVHQKIVTKDDSGEILNIKESNHKNEVIASVPVMIGSKFCSTKNSTLVGNKELNMCKFDNGGYFIINGTEKVVVSQERMCDNKVYIFPSKNTKHSFACEIRSNTHISTYSQLFSLFFYSNENINGDCVIKFNFPHIEKPQPLFLIFKYFGIESDRDIIRAILGNDMEDFEEYKEILEPSILEYRDLNLKTQEEIRAYLISKNKTNYDLDILMKRDILPHLTTNKEKILFIGDMVKSLIDTVLNKRKVSDRDHFKNKRIETPGILLSQVFRSSFEAFLSDLRLNSIKELNKFNDIDLMKIMKKSCNITNTLRYSLATGNWNPRAKNNKKIGVAQVLSRLTYSSTLSHLRRVNAPIDRVSKILTPRKLHNSQFMYMCAAESPEGATIGLVKNLTIGSFITNEYSPEVIKEYLKDDGIIQVEDIDLKQYDTKMTKVFINGRLFGLYPNNSYDLVENLKKLRRNLVINPEVSISFSIHTNDIVIYTDRGRVTRPLIVVKDNQPVATLEEISKLSWDENIRRGYIEYIDIEESENHMIAMDKKKLEIKNVRYTHLEIHPALMFGVCASLIPLPNHNQSPRNIYQSAMCKQAIGINSTNYLNRMDTMTHALHYPQRPLVYTEAADILGFNDLPAGQNIVVAIACHTGYNQEDSVILNKSAIERGFMHSTYYRSFSSEEKKNMSAMAKEKFCIPDPDTCMNIKYGSYDKLDTNGIVKVGEFVTDKDVIIGKITPVLDKNISSTKKNLKYKDSSTMLKHNESGTVDKIMFTHNADEHRVAKVRVRSLRTPIIGDKFASRQGQKGTVGMILPEEDMPYTEDGISPDLIINPHAIPSRITVATLLECVLGKKSAMENTFSDGTPFQDVDLEKIKEDLEDLGFSATGKETLYNGETGEEIVAQFFIGPIFYQKLKHMVKDKVHSRTTGPVTILTRQPLTGRSREGGLRFGEMETQCISAHGMAGFLKERMFDNSDKYETYICGECGLIAEYNEEMEVYRCKGCEDNMNNFSKINMPYAAKLLFNYMMPMSLVPRIRTE